MWSGWDKKNELYQDSAEKRTGKMGYISLKQQDVLQMFCFNHFVLCINSASHDTLCPLLYCPPPKHLDRSWCLPSALPSRLCGTWKHWCAPKWPFLSAVDKYFLSRQCPSSYRLGTRQGVTSCSAMTSRVRCAEAISWPALPCPSNLATSSII